MECRSGCGACCIAPSISTPFLGYPNGKPAGEPCKHLNQDYQCLLFDSEQRPAVCGDFPAELETCGSSRAYALERLVYLEAATA